ncbi:hypothetical protein [Streptomyces sp. NPDC097619]|uniref:hypothetical protein n=1 Tax=Streptomyces sp. NPDC097619 TaxID=3157228 RepID=UPI00331ACBC9
MVEGDGEAAVAAGVEAVAVELYGLRPEEFTAARDAHATRARREGDRDAAKRIAALRRPTLAVWAANLLARDDAEQARRLLELGQALREAHRTLSGEELRALSARRNGVVAAMAAEARRLADEAGHPVSEGVGHEVGEILRSVLADPEAAASWARGILDRAPSSAVDFTGLEPPPEAPRAPAAPAEGETARQTPESDTKATTTSDAGTGDRSAERARAAEERKARRHARAEADRTARERDRAEKDLARAEQDLEQARTALDALDRQVTELREQLDRAHAERPRLAAAHKEAIDRHRQAADLATRTRTAAERAEAALAPPADPEVPRRP